MVILKLLKYFIFLFLLTVVLFPANAQNAVSDNIIFEVEASQNIQISASETTMLIGLANNYVNNQFIFLKNINIQKGAKIIKNIPVGKYLFSQKKKIEKSEVLINELENTADEKRVKEILKEIGELKKEIRSQSFSGEISLKISDFASSPRVGEQYALTISADLFINGKPEKISREVIINFISPLPVQQGWYVGDGHVHSGHSELDGAYWFKRWRLIVDGPSIDDQTLAAKNFGLGWLIITDHEDMLNSEEWLQEVNEVGAAQENHNIQVMVGEEVGSVAPKISQGHYLAYGINSYVDANPFSGKDSIDKTKDAGGFGFIAHPDSRLYEWKDWAVEGYAGYQILAEEERVTERKTLQRWNEHLDSNKKPVATGNSDSHWQDGIGSTRTYLKTRGEVNHQSIYNALKNGNAVVTNGPLLTFMINDAIIGETTNVPPGEQAVLNIQWTSNEDFGPMKEILVISKGGEILDRLTKEIQTLSGTTAIVYSITEPTYFRLVGQTTKGNIVYTNSIWVTNTPEPPLPPPLPPGINLSNNTTISIHPAMTSDVYGNIHVVWVDNVFGNWEIVYSKWDGSNWSKPINISNTLTDSNWPVITSDIFSRVHVTWDERISLYNSEVFYTMGENNGWLLSENISNIPYYASYIDIISDNLGYPHVVWREHDVNSTNSEIFYSKKNGYGWSTPVNVSRREGYSSKPVIALDNFQYPHIAWEEPIIYENEDIFYSTWNGIEWLLPVNVSNTPEYSSNSDIVITSNIIHVFWGENSTSSNSEIFYSSKRLNDINWSTPTNFSNTSDPSSFPIITSDIFENAHLVWVDVVWLDYSFVVDVYKILYSLWNRTNWSSSAEIYKISPNLQYKPAVAIDNFGHIHIVWSEKISENNYEIFYTSK